MIYAVLVGGGGGVGVGGEHDSDLSYKSCSLKRIQNECDTATLSPTSRSSCFFIAVISIYCSNRDTAINYCKRELAARNKVSAIE